MCKMQSVLGLGEPQGYIIVTVLLTNCHSNEEYHFSVDSYALIQHVQPNAINDINM